MSYIILYNHVVGYSGVWLLVTCWEAYQPKNPDVVCCSRIINSDIYNTTTGIKLSMKLKHLLLTSLLPILGCCKVMATAWICALGPVCNGHGYIIIRISNGAKYVCWKYLINTKLKKYTLNQFTHVKPSIIFCD